MGEDQKQEAHTPGPMHPAIQNLMDCQRQLDMDGCEVGVSRQALDETFGIIADLLEALKDTVASLEQTLTWREGWECSEEMLLGDARAAIAKATPQGGEG